MLVVGISVEQILGKQVGIERGYGVELGAASACQLPQDRQHLLLSRVGCPAARHEQPDHPGHVLPRGTHDVLVVWVCVGQRGDRVLHPIAVENLHKAGVERHALPQEHLRAEPGPKLEHLALLPDGRLVIGPINEDLPGRQVAARMDKHRLTAGRLDDHVVAHGVKQRRFQPLGTALSARPPSAHGDGNRAPRALDAAHDPRSPNDEPGQHQPHEARQVKRGVARRRKRVLHKGVRVVAYVRKHQRRQVFRNPGHGRIVALALDRARRITQRDPKAQLAACLHEAPLLCILNRRQRAIAQPVQVGIAKSHIQPRAKARQEAPWACNRHDTNTRYKPNRVREQRGRRQEVIHARQKGCPAAHMRLEPPLPGHACGRHLRQQVGGHDRSGPRLATMGVVEGLTLVWSRRDQFVQQPPKAKAPRLATAYAVAPAAQRPQGDTEVPARGGGQCVFHVPQAQGVWKCDPATATLRQLREQRGEALGYLSQRGCRLHFQPSQEGGRLFGRGRRGLLSPHQLGQPGHKAPLLTRCARAATHTRDRLERHRHIGRGLRLRDKRLEHICHPGGIAGLAQGAAAQRPHRHAPHPHRGVVKRTPTERQQRGLPGQPCIQNTQLLAHVLAGVVCRRTR